MRTPAIVTTFFMAALVFGPASAEEPLHRRIDRHIDAKTAGRLSEQASDGEFLRRVYLDLVGRIPSIGEVREFLAETDENKRESVINRLLASDEHPQRMAALFDVILMERRGGNKEWTKFLQQSFAANKPWDTLVREILNPAADDESTRGAAFFYTKRLEKYGQNPIDMPGLVRDVGRLFLGMDVQCAQCHDHLFVDDYKQVDYQGLFAFVGQTFIRKDVKFPAVGERPLTKKVAFASVFDMEQNATGPRLPDGEEANIPTFKSGEEFTTPPDRKTRTPGVLKFSPIRLLSQQLPQADNVRFRRNIANRLWWVMMGRGLVHPLDLHHDDNPASHPELLDLLADEFAAHKFNIQWMLRELALTRTYQRSSLLPDEEIGPSPAAYAAAYERRLSAEQLLAAMLQATGEYDRFAKDKSARDPLLSRFQSAFANPPKEPEVEISPTVKAALFLLNDETVLSWLKPRPSNLIGRLSKLKESGAIAEELYLSVLTRRPTVEERREVDDYLSHSSSRGTSLSHLAWALLASTEFCVNH